MTLERRVAKLEEEHRRSEQSMPGRFPWFSPKIWEIFGRPPDRWHEVVLTEQEQREWEEWLAANEEPPDGDGNYGCLPVMKVLEQMEARAVKYEARLAACASVERESKLDYEFRR